MVLDLIWRNGLSKSFQAPGNICSQGILFFDAIWHLWNCAVDYWHIPYCSMDRCILHFSPRYGHYTWQHFPFFSQKIFLQHKDEKTGFFLYYNCHKRDYIIFRKCHPQSHKAIQKLVLMKLVSLPRWFWPVVLNRSGTDPKNKMLPSQ